jgi:WD repeat-containing protein 35
MKTAMRLIEYEKELQTKDVYSLVALACYFNECYRDCSKAFVKLERLPDISEKEREQYEMLAINLFSRHAPIDKPKKEFNCPKRDCKARITELYVLIRIKLPIVILTARNVEVISPLA